MKHGTHFKYDGIWSYEMGVIKVNRGTGLFSDTLVSGKRIIEERIDGRSRPYFYGVERDPLSFPLSIYFERNLTIEQIRKVLRWLDQDTYKPFYMQGEPDRIWYAMSVDDTETIHNGIASGYLELTMRTDDAHTLTPYVLSKKYSFRNNTEGEIIEIINEGDFGCFPIVHINKIGNGDITIKNLSNDTGDFTFVDLQDTEKIFVDCENEEIVSDGIVHRYNHFSNNFLVLTRGVNRLKVIGDCELRFETEFKTF